MKKVNKKDSLELRNRIYVLHKLLKSIEHGYGGTQGTDAIGETWDIRSAEFNFLRDLRWYLDDWLD